MRIGKRVSIAGALVLLAAAALVPAATADSTRVTQGDVEAIFQATSGGFDAVSINSPTLQGAPADRSLGRIGPFGTANGRHYCSLDWHVINADIGEVGSYTDAAAVLDRLVVTITLDGSNLPLSTTAIKRVDPQWLLANFGLAEAYARDFGAMLSPDALSVGTHTVSITVFDPVTGELDPGSATFYIDAPGSGACV